MNALRNKVQLIGRLGQEPEIVTFNDGNKMAKFSLATDDSYKDKEGQKVERAYWHNIVVKGGLVTVVESYVKKGQEIAIDKLVWEYLERFEEIPAKLKFICYGTLNYINEEKIPIRYGKLFRGN